MSAPDRSLPVILTRAAREDYEDIRVYTVQAWDEDQWVTYRTALNRGLQTLGDHPNIGRARADLPPGYRSYPVEQHIIYYRVLPHMVRVMRILHRRMDASRALRPRG